MIDSKLAGTGNSRFLKSVSNFKTLYPTYDDFVAALVTGTLPIDLNGINPDGWTQQGTPLNKANLLSDDVANGLGLTDDATPNGAFNAIISAKGKSNGFATLDSSGKVPSNQLPSMNYIPTSQKGVANGVASLDSNGKVPSGQLNLSSSVSSTSTTTAANSAAVKTAYDKAVSAYNLANGKPSVSSGTPTLSAYANYPAPTLDKGGWVRIGNLVVVDIVISSNLATPSTTTDYEFTMKGLPTSNVSDFIYGMTFLKADCRFVYNPYNGYASITNIIDSSVVYGSCRLTFSYIAS